MEQDNVHELAVEAARAMGISVRPTLRVVGVDRLPGLSALQRDVLYSRIRDLGNLYALNWLIRQETMHVLGVVECLNDDELTSLLAKMERGMEARLDGVPFDEVGLVRGATCNWVA